MRLDDAAVAFARAGIPIFPLAPGGKVPLTSNGLYAATCDIATIKGWWARTPEANIGMPTGESCGWDVLDIDPATKHTGEGRHRGDGWDALRIVRDAGLLPAPILTVRTPSGGAHLYYRAIPGARNGALSNVGVDYRAGGGYVVVPPSRTPEGSYVTVQAPVPDRSPNQCHFDRLRYAFSTPGHATASWRTTNPTSDRITRRIHALVTTVAEAASGNRNNVLFWAAKVAVTEHLDCLPLLHEAAQTAGLTAEEATATVASAARQPRRRTPAPAPAPQVVAPAPTL